MRIKIGSMVKFYTIILLYEGNKHGYELIKKLREKLGRNISSGQIYPFLKVLENNKIIKVEKRGERDKKIYSLTKKGKAFAENMLSRFGDLIDIAIEPKLKVCAHCGCKVYKGGYQEKIGKRYLTFCCKHCADSFKKSKK